MKNNNVNPMANARELGFSIINSAEYEALKKSEQDILNNKTLLDFLRNSDLIQGENDNSIKLKLDSSKIQEIQQKFNESTEIIQYLEANRNYERLLKNIYNIIEYITEDKKLSNSNKGCCGKCHSNCTGCEK